MALRPPAGSEVNLSTVNGLIPVPRLRLEQRLQALELVPFDAPAVERGSVKDFSSNPPHCLLSRDNERRDETLWP